MVGGGGRDLVQANVINPATNPLGLPCHLVLRCVDSTFDVVLVVTLPHYES